MTENPVKTGVNRKPGTFVKGDARINRKGRPVNSFDKLRHEWQAIWNEIMLDSNGKPIIDDETGKQLSRIKARMRIATSSRNVQEFRTALEYAYGKPKDEIDITGGLVVKIVKASDDSDDSDDKD